MEKGKEIDKKMKYMAVAITKDATKPVKSVFTETLEEAEDALLSIGIEHGIKKAKIKDRQSGEIVGVYSRGDFEA